MGRALFGIETEYAIVGRGDPISGEDALTAAASALFGPLFKAAGTLGMTENGARLYLDIGSHPEYATGECTSLRQLVASVQAGERIMSALTRQKSLRRNRARTQQPQIGLLANNRDATGIGWGCHENYLIARSKRGTFFGVANHDANGLFERLQRDLTPFFVSRQLYSGAGCIDTQGATPQFRISQRFDAFGDIAGSGTTTKHRFIFNTRDEPHAESQYRRLHVIIGDSNRSEWATFLKVGTTQLVLDMVAAEVDLSAAHLAWPVEAIRAFSRLDLTDTSPSTGGRALTALDVQHVYLEAAERHFASHESSLDGAETAQVLGMWREAVDALDTGDIDVITDRLGTKVDWVIKWRLLNEYMTKHEVGLENARVQSMDLAYGDIANPRYDASTPLHMLRLDDEIADPPQLDQASLFSTLRERGRVATLVSNDEIEALVQRPPQTSRAALRGDWITRVRAAGLRARGQQGSTDWEYLRAQALGGRPFQVPCMDPFATHSDAAEAALKVIETPPVQLPTRSCHPGLT